MNLHNQMKPLHSLEWGDADGGSLVRAVGEEFTAVGPWPLFISSCLQNWWVRKGQHSEKGLVPGRLPVPWDWHLQAESGVSCLVWHLTTWVALTWLFLLDFVESNQLLNWNLFLKWELCHMCWFYLICVMISPLQIWILIKNTFW